jgi:predicted ATPase
MGDSHPQRRFSGVRQVEELKVWKELRKGRASEAPDLFVIGANSAIDLSHPCTILGGRNGAGKSRLLRSIAAHHAFESQTLYLDMYRLCEQALAVLRKEKNLAEMKDELGVIGPGPKRLEDVRRIVGRDYDSVDWYALDLGPESEDDVERFRWGADDPLMPYFTATYGGVTYDAIEMGLGEFSVHFLLWILEQYRDREGLLLLLDEPDAFLPPVGVNRLLSRLLAICQQRGWRMIISTHSEEMIASAVEHDAFVLLRMGNGGVSEASHSELDRTIADTLLARPSIERVIFVEDESAWYLTRALLDKGDRNLSRTTSLVWARGEGDLRKLRARIPRPPQPEIKFAIAPDGDQRGKMSSTPSATRWPVHFLPTHKDPDELFRTLKSDPAELAEWLGADADELRRRLDELEGADNHDWVNGLGETYGRAHVLTVLGARWVMTHPDEAQEFADAVRRER